MSNVTKKYHLLEQFSVRNKTGLLLVLLYFVLIGIEKSRHSLNQSDKKTKPNHNLVTHVFPRIMQLVWFFFEFLSAL